jgi:hypothetical protein
MVADKGVVKRARQHFEERLGALQAERSSWEASRREICRLMFPEYDRFQRGNRSNKGDASFKDIMDSSPRQAAEVFAEGICNGMTNPARRWFLLRHEKPQIADRPDIEAWQDECGVLMLEAMGRGNLYDALVQVYREYGTFGDSCALGEEDQRSYVHWHNFAPGEYYLAVNSRGEVDTCYREFEMTAAQLVGRFGLMNVSMPVADAYKNNNRQYNFPVVHAIEPVASDKMEGVDDRVPFHAKYRSVYFEYGDPRRNEQLGREGLLDVSGYLEFPVMAPRLGVASNNAYGYGRGYVALGDIKQLMYWQKLIDRASEMEVDPPTQIPASMRNGIYSTAPGAQNFYNDTAGAAPVKRLFESRFSPEYAEKRVEILKRRIDLIFFKDVFTLFSDWEGSQDLRIPQISEMRDEKLLRMGGVFQPVIPALRVVVDRYFGVMMRRGELPLPPEDIQGDTVNVTYQSIIAQAQRQQGVAGLERFTGFVGQTAQLQGSMAAWNMVKTNEVIEDYADMVGVPSKMLRSSDEAEQLGQQQQAMQQAAAAAQMAKDGASSAKTLAETPTEGDNYLNAIAGGMRQMAGAT